MSPLVWFLSARNSRNLYLIFSTNRSHSVTVTYASYTEFSLSFTNLYVFRFFLLSSIKINADLFIQGVLYF